MTSPIATALKLVVAIPLAEIALFDWGVNLRTVLVAFLITEVTYYWYHRLAHRSPWIWRLHGTHHSASEMNFATALRINALEAATSLPVVLVPVFIGVPIELALLMQLAGLLYQLPLHTELVGRLPAIEGWLGTPSAHRVHHGTNRQYIDKNFAAVLTVLDRIFGTYEPELEPVAYASRRVDSHA